jgi:hypothetical protein
MCEASFFLLCLLALLPALFYFTTSKLYFSTSFVPFVSCPPSFCIIEILFLYFVFFLCSLATSVLHVQRFIFLLCLLSLLPVHLYFAFSKFNLFASFVPFIPCQPPFYILKASFLCFLYSFCSLPTIILNTRSFISLLCLLLLLFAHFHFTPLKLQFSISIIPFASCQPPFYFLETLFVRFFYSLCSICFLLTSILHPQSFISLLRLLSLLHVHLDFASLKLLFSALFAPFAPYPLLFCILKASFLCFVFFLCSLPTSILHHESFICLLRLLRLHPSHFHFVL